ncbi:MAG: hypothetical protein HKM86_08170 [Deltaproteobacteria bacterium]|nr:hypothetical protein [Deltaproteobacteria bacterium]
MRKSHAGFTLFLIVLCSILAVGTVYAERTHRSSKKGRKYAVTITNLTRGQVITPPVVIVHNEKFRLFVPGEPAIPELAALAEDGITGPLLGLLPGLPSVLRGTMAPGPLMPGESVTVEVRAKWNYPLVTVAGMLASSNDAFFAIRGKRVPVFGKSATYAVAYDAGSEANLELCDQIPGPPCGNEEVRHTEGAENYVHVHSGIHGIGDLLPEVFDWRNPVAKVVISPIH